jgi:hypothetical protein
MVRTSSNQVRGACQQIGVEGLKTFISGLVILLSWSLYLASVNFDHGVTILL